VVHEPEEVGEDDNLEVALQKLKAKIKQEAARLGKPKANGGE
jgi:hypothetical protein